MVLSIQTLVNRNHVLYFLNIYFIDYAITVVPFPPPFSPLQPAHSLPHAFSHLSPCPWVINISSLVSTFPTLFSTSPCPFYTYHLCYLLLVPFPLLPLLPFPADNLPCDLHFCDSVLVLVVCLVHCWFCFFLGSDVDSCEFVVILLFVFLIFFFFLDKSL